MIATLPTALVQTPTPEPGRSKTLLSSRETDAAQFTIDRDAKNQEKLTLRKELIARWTNPTRSHAQRGHVFLATDFTSNAKFRRSSEKRPRNREFRRISLTFSRA